MDTDAIYSAVFDFGQACRRRDEMEQFEHRSLIRALLTEVEAEHKSLLATNEKLVDEVNELKAKLTDKASLLRGCYAADHKQKQRIEELIAELEAEREESKRWLVKAQNERDARKELEAELERLTNCLKKANDQAEDFERRWYLADMELERIKALEPVAWRSRVKGVLSWWVELQEPPERPQQETQPLYALGSKTNE